MLRREKGIILGAGLAGLSAAAETGFPIFEVSASPGGTAGSVRKDGFVFDVGIHIMQSKDPDFHRLMSELEVNFASHHRNAWIYNTGKYASYPFQVNTSNLPWLNRFKCVAGYLNRQQKGTPANYGEWIIQNFGRGFAELFMFPYAEKFWRISPYEMTYEWAGGRVPQPRTSDVIRGAFANLKTDLGTNPTFTYPTAQGVGFSAIAEGFLPVISEINYGMRATSLDPGAGIVEFNNGTDSVAFDRLLTTIPLPELVGLVKDVPLAIRKAAESLSCNSIAVVNLGIGGRCQKEWHWAHYPGNDISFFRISFPHTFAEGLVPEGTSAIQAEVSYDRKAPPDREELIKRVCADLIRVGAVASEAPVVFADVLYQKYGYVIYDHLRPAAVRQIHDFFRNFGIFPCGRYGAWEYLWSDEAIMSGRDAAKRALSEVDALDADRVSGAKLTVIPD